MAQPDIQDELQVNSSNIATIAYDDIARELYVRFLNGSLYVYYQVPKAIWTLFKAAPSKGKFHWSRIRNGYNFRRVK